MVLKTCALDETTMVKAEMPKIACFIGVDEVPMVKADTLYRLDRNMQQVSQKKT